MAKEKDGKPVVHDEDSTRVVEWSSQKDMKRGRKEGERS